MPNDYNTDFTDTLISEYDINKKPIPEDYFNDTEMYSLNTKRYRQYLNTCIRKNGGRNLDTKIKYNHVHHIIPKALGGSDLTENKINVKYAQHYQAHLILAIDNMQSPLYPILKGAVLYLADPTSISGDEQTEFEKIKKLTQADLKRVVHDLKFKQFQKFSTDANPNLGREYTDDEKIKLFDIMQANSTIQQQSKEVQVYLVGETTPKKFHSIGEASRALVTAQFKQLNRDDLSARLNKHSKELPDGSLEYTPRNIRGTLYYINKLKDYDDPDRFVPVEKIIMPSQAVSNGVVDSTPKPVFGINIDDISNQTQKFNSLQEAARWLNVSNNSDIASVANAIKKCAVNNKSASAYNVDTNPFKQSYGYFWFYYNDFYDENDKPLPVRFGLTQRLNNLQKKINNKEAN